MRFLWFVFLLNFSLLHCDLSWDDFLERHPEYEEEKGAQAVFETCKKHVKSYPSLQARRLFIEAQFEIIKVKRSFFDGSVATQNIGKNFLYKLIFSQLGMILIEGSKGLINYGLSGEFSKLWKEFLSFKKQIPLNKMSHATSKKKKRAHKTILNSIRSCRKLIMRSFQDTSLDHRLYLLNLLGEVTANYCMNNPDLYADSHNMCKLVLFVQKTLKLVQLFSYTFKWKNTCIIAQIIELSLTLLLLVDSYQRYSQLYPILMRGYDFVDKMLFFFKDNLDRIPEKVMLGGEDYYASENGDGSVQLEVA